MAEPQRLNGPIDWAAKQADSRDVRLDELTSQIVDRVGRLARFSAEHGYAWAKEDQRLSETLSTASREYLDKMCPEDGIAERWSAGNAEVLHMLVASIIVDVEALRNAAGRDA